MLSAVDLQTGPNPRAAIVLMHGLGADGNDFVPIAQEMDLSAVGPVRFVFPNAPQMPVSINGGYVMPAWYDILPNRTQEDEAGLRHSQAAINDVLAHVQAEGIPAERIVLAGFSQGCAMALLTGLRYPQRLAGIVGMSGYLPLASTLAAERSPANQNTPIFLAHGRQDDMVTIDRGTATRDALQALGYSVEWHDYAMPHSVCPQEIVDLNRWLLQVLAP